MPRDWCASVGLDRATGLGWAGGYVGDGVATTNLAGRTLADLILGVDSDITRLPWVGHRSPRWEPEPLRWLGVNAGLWAMTGADPAEAQAPADRPGERRAVNRPTRPLTACAIRTGDEHSRGVRSSDLRGIGSTRPVFREVADDSVRR